MAERGASAECTSGSQEVVHWLQGSGVGSSIGCDGGRRIGVPGVWAGGGAFSDQEMVHEVAHGLVVRDGVPVQGGEP